MIIDTSFTYSEKHREKCEARHVLQLKMSKDQRVIYYLAVGKKRGEEAMKKLIEEVKKQYAKKT